MVVNHFQQEEHVPLKPGYSLGADGFGHIWKTERAAGTLLAMTNLVAEKRYQDCMNFHAPRAVDITGLAQPCCDEEHLYSQFFGVMKSEPQIRHLYSRCIPRHRSPGPANRRGR